MRVSLFLIALAMSSAACSKVEDYREDVGAETRAAASATATSGAKGVTFEDNAEKNGGSREFAYRWPAAVSAHPELVAMLEDERGQALAEQKSEWDTALADSPDDCVSCKSRSFEKSWEVVADLPRWLSLSSDFSVYTGGAHGMYGAEGLVFDKQARAIRRPLDLFASPAALQQAVEARWCAALDREREERRGEPVDTSDEVFGGCPGIDELTVLLGSSNGETFDRIGLIAGPYVAGSYAEGAYEVTLPVDEAVLAAVKPEYAEDFSVRAFAARR